MRHCAPVLSSVPENVAMGALRFCTCPTNATFPPAGRALPTGNTGQRESALAIPGPEDGIACDPAMEQRWAPNLRQQAGSFDSSSCPANSGRDRETLDSNNNRTAVMRRTCLDYSQVLQIFASLFEGDASCCKYRRRVTFPPGVRVFRRIPSMKLITRP
jgi:hypothetical protein